MMPDAPNRRNCLESVGARLLDALRYLGGMTMLLGAVSMWFARGVVHRRHRIHGAALAAQMVRIGVRSVGIVVLVQIFIGVILALQLAPPLSDFGQQASIANIIGIGGFRMLGPILTAVVLSGFAGASIAAELGTMTVSEEIEALEVLALNPVRYLVLPRIIATVLMMIMLTVIADLAIAAGGYLAAIAALSPDVHVGYWTRMRLQLHYRDLFTGLVQGGVFGLLMGLIACQEGLNVRGGAEGVGRATTMTVVYSIVGIGAAAAIFTVIFFTFKL